MGKSDDTQESYPLIVLENYGLPADMREKLRAYFDTKEIKPAKDLAGILSKALHKAPASELAGTAAKILKENIDSDHFCHALGWLALERDALALQMLYEAIPSDQTYYAHAEWVVPFEENRRWELPFGNQYFLAHYNELYHYPDGEPPGLLTDTGLCAQILALMSHRGWQSILPTSNQMIAHFNKLLWMTRDFDMLSEISSEPHENFEKFYADMVAQQESLIEKARSGTSEGLGESSAKEGSKKKTGQKKKEGAKSGRAK